MILKNFVTPFVYARGLKNLGYKQENHLFYYHNKTKELYPAISLITGAPDFSKRFTAAPTDADLNHILPKSYIHKKNKYFLNIEFGDKEYKGFYNLLRYYTNQAVHCFESDSEVELKSRMLISLLTMENINIKL